MFSHHQVHLEQMVKQKDATRINNEECLPDLLTVSYIGYTTNRLKTRAGQHRYAPSKINKHAVDCHKKAPKLIDSFLDSFRVLYRNNSKRHLLIAEALSIRQEAPRRLSMLDTTK